MERLYKERRSLSQTSAGLAHTYIQPAPFQTETCKDAPLPPLLQRQTPVPQSLHYSLTSHTEHNYKPIYGPLGNIPYSKASPHWNTHFLNDLAQRLKDCRSVRVVSQPVSEMQDHYRGQSATHQPLQDHYRTLLALYGQLERAPALLPKEPLLSTTQVDYRRFSRSELAPPSALKAPPIQVTLTSRLPPHKALSNVPTQLHLPRPCIALPPGGKNSLYMESFTVPGSLPKVSTSAGQDGEKYRNESGRGLLQQILEVPKCYGTENQSYGKGKMVLV